MQRLRDIIEEVEKQLRSVKLQAAKAQRYQEHHARLKELRIALGLGEFHELAEHLEAEAAVLENLRRELADGSAQVEASEAEVRRLEESLARLEEVAHEQEGLLAHARQQIAAAETTQNHEWSLAAELDTDLAATRVRMTELNARVGALTEAAARAAEELHGVQGQASERRHSAQLLESELAAAAARLGELSAQVESDKAEHLELMRQAARLQNDAVGFRAQVDNLRREHERLRLKTAQAAEHLASIDLELQELTEAEEALQTRLTNARQSHAEQRQERERLRQLADAKAQALADLRASRSGLASRVEVLEGLERSHEGLGTGVREVVALLEQPDPGPWQTVIGMIADLLRVRREYAPLIDLALGERSQRFVIRDGVLLDEALKQYGKPFSGRVSFLPIGPAHPDSNRPNRLIELSASGRVRMPISPEGVPDHPGVVALAEQLIVCDHPDLEDLPAQLLGRTLIVKDLAAARDIAAHTSGYRLLTLNGELLEPDGTLTLGAHHAETGVLSRKSELRELRQQVLEFDESIRRAEGELGALRERAAEIDRRGESLQQEIDVLAEQAADLRSRIGQHRERRHGLNEEVTLSQSEISGVQRQAAELEESWQRARTQAEQAEQRVQLLQARLQAADCEIREHDRLRQQRQQTFTAAKVALAQVEERLTALQAKHLQIETDLEQRRQEQAQGERHLAGARARLEESHRTMLEATASLARWYLEKEKAEQALAGLSGERDLARQERQLLAERVQGIRSAWQARQEQAHARELEVNNVRNRRDVLIARLREDYQIDLAELYERSRSRARELPAEANEFEQGESAGAGTTFALLSKEEVAAANEEIEELRRKLSRLGSVNLDSLQELTELEQRATAVQVQYADLTNAKKSLEEIIQEINQDSRRLFTETLATIRVHFQELFRKLFGGGMADILLEDDNDILESGIEIIARPPGKELRSISLMSGGEKTLTAVALLLAIFRSKPSPFCILDEVDAALDEANIGRYTAVLREFLDRSQFIIVTHSKKTMACADVLYGVTMQESGVSKQVAVRFEDWPDEDRATEVERQQEVA